MQLEKIENHIVGWLGDYLKTSGCKGFVIGISGGVDSALTATLAAKTGAPVLCVELPIHQDPTQVARGVNQIEHLKSSFDNVSSTIIDLTQAYDTLKASFPITEDDSLLQLSLANSQSRLRMTSLYYLAGIHQSLVLGTGNKIEDFGVGFFTKYGDGGVDLSPIADLTKSEVFALAKHVNVDKEILKAPPTDGLWGDERTDEDQLGASYDELEWAMEQADLGSDEIAFTGREKEVYSIYNKLHRVNKHKMHSIPICKITDSLKT